MVSVGDAADMVKVNWDSSKDNALWKILSGAAQTEINCEYLSVFMGGSFGSPHTQGIKCRHPPTRASYLPNQSHPGPIASTFPSISSYSKSPISPSAMPPKFALKFAKPQLQPKDRQRHRPSLAPTRLGLATSERPQHCLSDEIPRCHGTKELERPARLTPPLGR